MTAVPKTSSPALDQALDVMKAGRTDDALPLLEDILEKEENATAHMLAGEALLFQGNKDKAADHFTRAHNLMPGDPEPLYHLITFDLHKTDGPEDLNLKALQRMEEHSGQMPPDQQVLLYYALAHAYRSLKDHDRAFEYAQKGAAAKKTIVPFDPNVYGAYYEAIKAYFTPDFYRRNKEKGLKTKRPVFICGFPRSGTTLVEQILASHPEVAGIGENATFKTLLAEKSWLPPDPDNEGIVYPYRWPAPQKGEKSLKPKEIARDYNLYLQKQAPGAERVVNKAIFNPAFAGMMPVCFPQGRIISVIRDPMDTCLSAFFTNFTGDSQPYTYDLAELGTTYRAVRDLMTYWNTVIPDYILTIHYEDLIADQESVTRQIIDFIDLKWDPACLSFHETQRTVRTASAGQIRSPIFKSSLGRWKPYEQHLKPLLKALGPYAPSESV